MNRPIPMTMAVAFAISLMGIGLTATDEAAAQEELTLSSPVLEDQSMLPADLKCERDGGDGLSLPLTWSGVPEGTQSFALAMTHYPRGTEPGRDDPSHYWLLWDIPGDARQLPRGNLSSIGHEGADKDQHRVGYTPPCSPGNQQHEYTITLHALSTPPQTLKRRR